MDPVNLFVPVYRIDETLAEIRECLEKGWTGLGFKTVQFEAAWKKYTGLPHAHFLNSATAGLHLAVRMLKEDNGWRDGDEIISTPLTFISTNHAISYEKLRPVFADIDEYLCLDPQSVEDRINSKTRAVMFVGVGGNAGRLDRNCSHLREEWTEADFGRLSYVGNAFAWIACRPGIGRIHLQFRRGKKSADCGRRHDLFYGSLAWRKKRPNGPGSGSTKIPSPERREMNRTNGIMT